MFLCPDVHLQMCCLNLFLPVDASLEEGNFLELALNLAEVVCTSWNVGRVFWKKFWHFCNASEKILNAQNQRNEMHLNCSAIRTSQELTAHDKRRYEIKIKKKSENKLRYQESNQIWHECVLFGAKINESLADGTIIRINQWQLNMFLYVYFFFIVTGGRVVGQVTKFAKRKNMRE